MTLQEIRVEIALLQDSLTTHGHFAAAELLEGHLAELEEGVSPSRADVLLEGAQSIVNAVEIPLGTSPEKREPVDGVLFEMENTMKELESIFPDFVASAYMLVTILERDGCDDILPEAKALAAKIDALSVEVQAAGGKWSDDLKRRAGDLSKDLSAIAAKVSDVPKNDILSAFEEAFQQMKDRRDGTTLH